jgi:hypothetical protein
MAEEGEFGFVSRDQGLLDRAAGAPDAEEGETASGSTPEELAGSAAAAAAGSSSTADGKRGSVASSNSTSSKTEMEPDPAAKSSDILLPQIFQVSLNLLFFVSPQNSLDSKHAFLGFAVSK